MATSLTLAVLSTEGDHGGGIAGAACLVGAVTDTVAEVGLAAVALNIALTAAELRGRDAEHAVDASALWKSVLVFGFRRRSE